MLNWSSGGKSAQTDSAAPALLSHLRRLRLRQEHPGLCGAVSRVYFCYVVGRCICLPYRRRAMVVLYI